MFLFVNSNIIVQLAKARFKNINKYDAEYKDFDYYNFKIDGKDEGLIDSLQCLVCVNY